MDGWTSPNFISFLGVTAHWVVGAQLQNVTLDFIRCVLDRLDHRIDLVSSVKGETKDAYDVGHSQSG